MMADTTQTELLPPYIDELRRRFEQRRSQNGRYSLRAFSRDLKLSAGAMSEVFSGKRPLTLKMAQRIATCLQMTDREQGKFLLAVEAAEQMGTLSKTLRELGYDRELQIPSDQNVAVLSEPHHFHILHLFYTNGFKQEPTWIAQRLGLQEEQVQESLTRLHNSGLLEKTENGDLKPTNQCLNATGEAANSEICHFHKRTLEKTIESLGEVPPEFHDITSVSFSIKSAQIPYLKKLIETFRLSMAAIGEREDGDEVYALNIQLVPVTKLSKAP